MSVREWLSRSELQTKALGACVARAVRPPVWIGLDGSLGSGKTRFVQGFAKEMGYEGRVRSPTFVLENRYHARVPLCHQDLYRLAEPDDEIVAAWEDNDCGIFLVEWSARTEEAPERSMSIRIDGSSPDVASPANPEDLFLDSGVRRISLTWTSPHILDESILDAAVARLNLECD